MNERNTFWKLMPRWLAASSLISLPIWSMRSNDHEFLSFIFYEYNNQHIKHGLREWLVTDYAAYIFGRHLDHSLVHFCNSSLFCSWYRTFWAILWTKRWSSSSAQWSAPRNAMKSGGAQISLEYIVVFIIVITGNFCKWEEGLASANSTLVTHDCEISTNVEVDKSIILMT